MSQFQKVFDVLDLFTEERTTLSAEEVSDLLAVSRPTAFRYLRWLTETGLLSRLSGRYAIGARIMELDYRSRRSDPLLLAARDVMTRLTEETQCSAMLSGVFGDKVVNIHQDEHRAHVSASFGRGRALPLFRGAASKVVLAHLGSARLKRLFDDHGNDPDVQALGQDWPEFSKYFRAIRQRGFYVSKGEVDNDVAGVAAPIFNAEGGVAGALTLLLQLPHGEFLDTNRLGNLVLERAREISDRLAQPPMPTNGTAAGHTSA